MTIGNYIFWISAGVLFVVFAIWCITFFHRSKREAVPIVFAGKSHGECPTSKEVDSATIDRLRNRISSKLGSDVTINPYLVHGNSMQFANIKDGDLVFAECCSESDSKFPKIVVLSGSDANTGSIHYKLRRAWSDIPSNADGILIRERLQQIVNSDEFIKLRHKIGTRCPSDEELINVAIEKYRMLSENQVSVPLLVSTTYRSDRNRIEFSIHPKSTQKGVVVAACSPTDRV